LQKCSREKVNLLEQNPKERLMVFIEKANLASVVSHCGPSYAISRLFFGFMTMNRQTYHDDITKTMKNFPPNFVPNLGATQQVQKQKKQQTTTTMSTLMSTDMVLK
jgi:hypothetical protein